jgi:hypothetical protein
VNDTTTPAPAPLAVLPTTGCTFGRAVEAAFLDKARREGRKSMVCRDCKARWAVPAEAINVPTSRPEPGDVFGSPEGVDLGTLIASAGTAHRALQSRQTMDFRPSRRALSRKAASTARPKVQPVVGRTARGAGAGVVVSFTLRLLRYGRVPVGRAVLERATTWGVVYRAGPRLSRAFPEFLEARDHRQDGVVPGEVGDRRDPIGQRI